MLNVNEEELFKVGYVLSNTSRPLKQRFRALFTLKNIGGPVAVKCIVNCFDDSSALLKHELAYCLGQMQDENALPILVSVLENDYQEPMVRHEAAEAIGAIGSKDSISILEKFCQDPVTEVAETCQLAIDRIKWVDENKTDSTLSENPYASIDPAPPAATKDVNKLKTVLLDETASLFERYRAMFALRNLRTEEATLALTEGLNAKSALFKHEIAFVLGQLQEEISVPFLIKKLEDPNENEMVRHECAEALGAIATPDCFTILNVYLGDDNRVVKESCEIALDMCSYENSPEFQYANSLLKNIS